MNKIEIAQISYGKLDSGRRVADVSFVVRDTDVEDFDMVIAVHDAGDPTETANAAKSKVRKLINDLADETKNWP